MAEKHLRTILFVPILLNDMLKGRTKRVSDMNKPNEKPITTGTGTVLIVNPSSSSGSTGKNWDDLYLKIKEIFGENPEVAFTKKSGDGTILARAFLEKGVKNIIAIGGDGTINEVANGFFVFQEEDDNDNNNPDITPITATAFPEPPTFRQINPNAVLGIVPSGTRNVLAKSLNLPTGDLECCKHFVGSKTQKIDVISATATNPSIAKHPMTQPRIFLNAAEIGVGAEIIDRSKRVKEKVKSRIVSTISSVVITLPTYTSKLCEIFIDDGRGTNNNILTKMTMCVIANGKYLGGGLTVAPQASVSDGLLDMVILKNSGSFKMLEEFISMKNSNYTSDDKDIIYMRAKRVSIRSREEKKRDITVTIDGEPIGILPATFQVYPNVLLVKL
jgi:diacylglycerol kinase family enzyme